MEKIKKQIMQLMLVVTDKRVYCYWCGQKLRECGACHGKGVSKSNTCSPCKGSGLMCPTHEADWD